MYMCCARVGRRAIGQTHMFFTIQNWRHLSEQRLVFFSSGIWFVAFCLNFCFISTRIMVQACVANCIDILGDCACMHGDCACMPLCYGIQIFQKPIQIIQHLLPAHVANASVTVAWCKNHYR